MNICYADVVSTKHSIVIQSKISYLHLETWAAKSQPRFVREILSDT